MALRSEQNDKEAISESLDEDDHAIAARVETDHEAFTILYDRYVDRIYGYCHRRLQTREAAEDATSQTFLKAFAVLTRGGAGKGSFKSWLFTIAYHLVVDSYRARKPFAPLTHSTLVAQPGPGPEDRALTNESGRELYALISRLPDDQSDLLHLRLSGLNDREIADVIGKSCGAVRVAQHRAMKRLREMAVDESILTRTES